MSGGQRAWTIRENEETGSHRRPCRENADGRDLHEAIENFGSCGYGSRGKPLFGGALVDPGAQVFDIFRGKAFSAMRHAYRWIGLAGDQQIK